MPTVETLEDALFDWAEPTVSPTPVFWEDADDADRKEGRVSLRVLDDISDHHPHVEISEGGEERIVETAMVTLVVNCRGEGSKIVANKLRASLHSGRRHGFDSLWKYTGLGSISAITNLSSLESAQIGARHEFRVKLHTTLEHTFETDCADTIGVSVNAGRLGEVLDLTLGTDPHPIPEDC